MSAGAQSNRHGRGNRRMLPVPVKPVRTMSQNQTVVECPECHAAVGEPCVSANGNAKSAKHTARLRLAARWHREHPPVMKVEVDTRPVCPRCGKHVATRGDGSLRAHKVDGVRGRVECFSMDEARVEE